MTGNAERAKHAQDGPVTCALRGRCVSTQAREDLLRAFAELLVGRDQLRVLLRLALAREVVARDGGVEPRRRHLPASLRDVLAAARDLRGLARRRIVGSLDRRDFLEVRVL